MAGFFKGSNSAHSNLCCFSEQNDYFVKRLKALRNDAREIIGMLYDHIDNIWFENAPFAAFHKHLQMTPLYCQQLITTLEGQSYESEMNFQASGYLSREFETKLAYYRDGSNEDKNVNAPAENKDHLPWDKFEDCEPDEVLEGTAGNKAPGYLGSFVFPNGADGQAGDSSQDDITALKLCSPDILTNEVGAAVGIACKGGGINV